MTDYLINTIYPAVQGEGVNAGIPMIILRLQGCDVGCPWCDTKETWAVDPAMLRPTFEEAAGVNPLFVERTGAEIAGYIAEHWPYWEWVLVTGGEPARFDLADLVDELHRHGYQVALETSGTETGHLGADFDWVCVSPKIAMPGGKRVQTSALQAADEIKHVIGKPADLAALDTLLDGLPLKQTVEICVQPVSQSQKATALCLQIVQERKWRLSLQLHKYIDQR